MAQLQMILNSPLITRCRDLSQVIKDTYFKELQNIFPILVESIFGSGPNNVACGWGIGEIRYSVQINEFESIRYFLSPSGPLLNLCYKLTVDSVANYEFDIQNLPIHTKQSIEDGVIPAFYSQRMKNDPGTAKGVIILNAFEFYMFHFAHYVVNPRNHRLGMLWGNPEDFLYPRLLDDYLKFFLPISGTDVPSLQDLSGLMSVSYSNTQTPLSSTPLHSPPTLNQNQVTFGVSPLQITSPQRSHLPLLKNLLPSPAVSANKHMLNQSVNRQENWRHQGEAWCSETFVQILIEFWLNQVPVSASRDSFEVNVERKYSPHADHMHMIRILVKHSHQFSGNMLCQTHASFNAFPHSAVGHLRKKIYTNFIQKKLYYFLRYSFDHWPLDASFRVLLELWLSAIQPWRYANGAAGGDSRVLQGGSPGDAGKKERGVDVKWKKFIVDNLLLYSNIFQQLIPRFFRMDLCTPENAYMLYRLMYVFSKPNLVPLITQVENCLRDSAMMGSGVNQDITAVVSGAGSVSNPVLGMAVRQAIVELEGPGYKYSSLVEDSSQTHISTLMNIMLDAIRASKESIEQLTHDSRGFWSGLYVILGGNGNTLEEEFVKANAMKVQQHLTTAMTNMCRIFNVTEPKLSVEDPVKTDRPTCHTTDSGRSESLTSREKLMIINGVIKPKNLGYKGNPDLQPIRSYECGFLVRQLYVLACLINLKFGEHFKNVYYSRQDFASRVLKSFLAPPIVCRTSNKFNQETQSIPPRISLRFLANYQNLGYLLSLYLLLHIIGYGIIPYIFLIAVMAIVYSATKALIHS